jgi:hypothetical protein
MSDPIDAGLTIGDLARSGARLGLYCTACARFRYLTFDRMPEQQIVTAIADKLSCVKCRSSEVSTRPVLRDAKTGYWPAESS